MLDYANYIDRCLQISRNGCYYVAPNPMVGAVLVDGNGRILGEGWHSRFGGPHAEVNCLSDALSRYGSELPPMKDCTLFVSLEPCAHHGKTPPCAELIVNKGIGRVVVSMLDPNPKVSGRGVQMMREAGIDVIVGVREQESRELNRRFLCLHEKHRPYVTLKWAQTADGFLDITRTSGTPLVISTPTTKQLVHRLRAENMAILVGSGTALLDDPRLLTTRWSGRNPARVLLDRRGRVSATARIFSNEAETIVYNKCTDWSFILHDLAQRDIHSVLVEGGAQVLRSVIESGLYDEVHVEVSPMRIGSGVEAPRVELPAMPTHIIDQQLLYEIKHDI